MTVTTCAGCGFEAPPDFAFCPRCGASVFGRWDDEVGVNLGSLDAPDQLTPTYELWTVRREAWLPPFPQTKRYERNREGSGRSEE